MRPRAANASHGPLTIHLDHAVDEPIRRYGFAQLCQTIGVPFFFGNVAKPSIYYGDDPLLARSARVWIQPDPLSDWRRHAPSLTKVDGIPVPFRGHAPVSLISGNRVEFDPAMATAYFLMLDTETSVEDRDTHGRVRAGDSLLARERLLTDPPVNSYAILLADMIWPDESPKQLLARWPQGKTWAVALTHDVDRPERPSLGRALLKELIFKRNLSRRQTYYALRAEIRTRGYRQAFLARPAKRREWDFAQLCNAERNAGLRSAYYFAVITKQSGHPCDVHYDIGLPRYRRLIRRLQTDGFEVGLHASYATPHGGPTTAEQVDKLTDVGGRMIQGVRHHYLQVNHNDPMITLNDDAQANLIYDATIGFNDLPGFRAGTALPYLTFHRQANKSMNFVELPMSLADMHLPSGNEQACCEIVLRHLQRVRELGGLAVLNWHVGHWFSDPAWRAAYLCACRFIEEDQTAWCGLPSEISEWWLNRQARLELPGSSPPPIRRSLIEQVFEWPPAQMGSDRFQPVSMPLVCANLDAPVRGETWLVEHN